jgi:N-acetyl-anhydromuramyl-L-alanine amidase AmpD
MVFYAYHWLVRQNGTAERLLKDEYIGWHAGKWDINTRSIGIALSGNFEHSMPLKLQLRGVANIIRDHYESVSLDRIFGHKEVRKDRTCPGEYFDRWKPEIMKRI